MGIKSLLLETKNAPRRCLVCMILLACCIALAVWVGGGTDLKTDGPVICLDGKATLRQRFDSYTICTTLAKGDSLRVLGIDRSSFGQRWLVMTPKGDIGWVDASDLPVRQIITDGKNKGDTVSVRAVWSESYIYYYAYTNSKGEEEKLSTKDFVPVLEGWDRYAYNRDGCAGVCSSHKFEAKTLGKSFDEVKKSFGSPVLLRITPHGMETQYSWKIFEPSTGKIMKPNVTFSADSVATAVSLGDPTSRAASWLKHMPLASSIIDWPVTSLMVRGSRYEAMADPMVTGFKKAMIIALIVVVLIVYFFWMFFTATLPVLLMGWVDKFPAVFYPLNDTWLKLLMFGVMFVSVYIWSVMMMAWGMFPFWSVLILIFGWYAFTLAASPLCYYPHIRCPKCRHLHTIKFDHEDFEYSEIKTGEDIRRGKLLGKRTATWKAWTQVTSTKTYSDGHKDTSTYNHDVHTKAQDYRTYEYIHYNVTYRLDHYRRYYKCDHCGLVEETTRIETTELDRQEIGRSVQESTYGDVYRKRW